MAGRSDLDRVLHTGIVAIIRSQSTEQLVQTARALYDGGVDVIELTFTVPNVLEILGQVRKDLGSKVLLGAGTVLDTETARAALLAGAEFIVSPVVKVDVIQMCKRYGKIIMPGAFTPTEILTAWEAGADVIKVFPAEIGGPAFLKAMAGPLPQIRLMPTGGVNLQTMRDFIKAGACAVGMGTALADPKLIKEGKFDEIRQVAATYVDLLKTIRAELAAK